MNRVRWLVSKAREIRESTPVDDATAFAQAVEASGRYGTPAPATIALARSIFKIADRSENMRRLTQ